MVEYKVSGRKERRLRKSKKTERKVKDVQGAVVAPVAAPVVETEPPKEEAGI